MPPSESPLSKPLNRPLNRTPLVESSSHGSRGAAPGAGALHGAARRPLFDVAEAARRTRGDIEGLSRNAAVRGVTIDSREVAPGDLFVALPGSKAHGHEFVAGALRAGAVAALVEPTFPPLPADLEARAVIRVASPRRALADLAAAHRRTLRCPVVGITGSNGKSSTREFVARVLEPLGDVVQSVKSYNNDLGVPLTVLRADAETAALVVEMGTSGPGEIARLVEIARPTLGIVTNVSAAHLQGLGDEDGVAHEKASLPRGLPSDGFAVLNGDDPRVAGMARQTQAHVLTTSLGNWRADVWAADARRTARGIEFFLFGKGRMFLPVPGLHNVRNALLAASCGLLHGITADQLRAQFRLVRLPALRMQRLTIGGTTLLLDCYNANPASLEAGVEELAARPARGRRVLVQGDMLELGARSADLHYAAGRHAALHALEGRLDFLWFVGQESRAAYDAAVESGVDPAKLGWAPSVDEAAAKPAVTLVRGDVALLKASRGMRIERLAETLRAAREQEARNDGAGPGSRRVG
ncbi:MAG: UDP-N-acetylmuramoyl-tripeptide--D-alanyl-D-alanine ligase [Planctomycetes bacterium]|nr:UDP-N-acetylmuramoyl-tripeptide--D-alanyl-D-alanine ligase [Planctomycetota bacterium]